MDLIKLIPIATTVGIFIVLSLSVRVFWWYAGNFIHPDLSQIADKEINKEKGEQPKPPLPDSNSAISVLNMNWKLIPKVAPYKMVKVSYANDPQIHVTRWFAKSPVYEISDNLRKSMIKELEGLRKRKEVSQLLTLDFSENSYLPAGDKLAITGGRILSSNTSIKNRFFKSFF